MVGGGINGKKTEDLGPWLPKNLSYIYCISSHSFLTTGEVRGRKEIFFKKKSAARFCSAR